MEDRGPAVLAVTAAMVSIATLFVLLRLLSRVFVVHEVRLDDWFIVAAWVISFGLSFAICYAVSFGLGRHQDTLMSSEIEVLSRLEYTFSVLYNPALMATKTSICTFYLSIARTRQVFKWSVVGTMVVVNAAGLALSLLNIFQCRPLTSTFLYPRPDTAHCTDIITLYFASAPVNIITDLVILLLPMPVLKSMMIPRKQKIVLYITFGFGVFVTAVDIIRIAYLQQAAQNRLADLIQRTGVLDSQQQTDFSWYASLSFMWTAVEVNVGIMVASVPHLKPLATRFLPRLLRETSQISPTRRASVATLNSTVLANAHRVSSNTLLQEEPLAANNTHRGSLINQVGGEEAMSFEDFLAEPVPGTANPPTIERDGTATARFLGNTRQGTSFMNFVDLSEMKSIVYLSNKESFRPVVHVTVLFFVWGFAYGLLSVLNGQFQLIAHMTTSETIAQHSTYYVGYFVGSLTLGRAILKHWGFKACYVIGLMIYGTGTLVFWPAAVLTSFAAFLVSNFIVGVGLSTLEIAANPFMALCGPPRYAEIRLNLSQGVQAIGTVLSPLLAQKALFGNVHDAPTLINVAWTYLAISLFTFVLAFIYYIVRLPECTDTDLETASRLTLPYGTLDRLRKSHTIAVTLTLGVMAQFLYVGGQEANGTAFGPYLVSVSPNANYDNYLAIGHSLFALSRFLAALACFVVKPRHLLLFFFVGAILFSILAMHFTGTTATTMLLMVYFFEGPLFGLIFAQSIRGLGKNTKDGATVLTAAISGGAVFSPIQHAVAVSHNSQYSYCVLVAALVGSMTFAIYLNVWPSAWEQCDPPANSVKLVQPESNSTNLGVGFDGANDVQFPTSPTTLDRVSMTENGVVRSSFDGFEKSITWGEKL